MLHNYRANAHQILVQILTNMRSQFHSTNENEEYPKKN